MPKAVEIEIEVDEQGQVKTHVKGAIGKACLEYMKMVEEILGKSKNSSHTPEFYETQTHQHIQGRKT